MNEIQSRSECTGLKFFTTIKEAFDHAKRDKTVWKISYTGTDGKRLRLVRRASGWIAEPIV